MKVLPLIHIFTHTRLWCSKYLSTCLEMSKPVLTDFDHLFVLDFESTCQEVKDPRFVQEIIEFPIVIVDLKAQAIETELRYYVKPIVNPQLSPFCSQLTGIQQETVDAADPFHVVFPRMLKFIEDFQAAHPHSSWSFVTCGDWDLKTMLKSQIKTCAVQRLPCPKAPAYFNSWINIKTIFADTMGERSAGMATILQKLRLPLVGKHHSGLDDCRNIATIALKLCAIQRGEESISISKVSGPSTSGSQTRGIAVASEAFPLRESSVARSALHFLKPRLISSQSLHPLRPISSTSSTSSHTLVRLSKQLSSALRHNAIKWRIPIRSDGYVKIRDLLSNQRFHGVNRQEIADVVDNSDKKRFQMDVIDGEDCIRAVQGHSIDRIADEELLEPITDPATVPLCVHGTYRKCIDVILASGLDRMGRNHIHMAIDIPGSQHVVSGARRNAEVLIFIDVARAMTAGIPFYRSHNNVILSPGPIPAVFFSDVQYKGAVCTSGPTSNDHFKPRSGGGGGDDKEIRRRRERSEGGPSGEESVVTQGGPVFAGGSRRGAKVQHLF